MKERSSTRKEKEGASKLLQEERNERELGEMSYESPSAGIEPNVEKLRQLEWVSMDLNRRVGNIEDNIGEMMKLLRERLPPLTVVTKVPSIDDTSVQRETPSRDESVTVKHSPEPNADQPDANVEAAEMTPKAKSWAQVAATPHLGTRASVQLDSRLFNSEGISSRSDEEEKKLRKRRESSRSFKKRRSQRKKKHRDDSSSSSSSSSSGSSDSSGVPKSKSSLEKDSDDSSLSTQSEDSNDLKRRMKRRKSILEIFQEQDRASDQPSNMLRMQPNYDGIKLENLHVSSVFRFKDELIRYRQENQVTVKASLRVSKAVRQKIMSKCRDIVEEERFYALSNKELFKYIQKVIRPRNVHMLLNELQRNVQFNPQGKGLWSFDQTHSEMITFVDEFTQAYEYLSRRCKAAKSLKWEYKPDTVVKLFVDKIGDYGRKVFFGLPQQKFSGWRDFSTQFMAVAKKHKKVLEEAKIIGNSYFRDHSVSNGKSTRKGQNPRYNNRNADQRKVPQAQRGDEQDLSELPDDSENGEVPNDSDDDSVQSGGDTDTLAAEISVTFDLPDEPATLAAVPTTILKRPGGNVTPGGSLVSKPIPKGVQVNACYNFAIRGRCDRERCTYSHDSWACATLRREIRDQMRITEEKSENSAKLPYGNHGP